MKKIPVFLAAIVAAVAASSCCILPLILGVASAGTVGLGAALAPYRPYLIGLTLLLLGVAFYFTYRPQKAGCDADGCETAKTVRTRRFSRAILWAVAVFTLGALAYPNLAAYQVSEAQAKMASVAVAPSAQSAVFTLGNMTCPECTLSIVKALKATPGVYDAKVDFTVKRATVRYDAKRVNVSELRRTIEKIRFHVTGMVS